MLLSPSAASLPSYSELSGGRSVLSKLTAWLWDPSGNRRREQLQRQQSSLQKVNRNREVRDLAMQQIRRTHDLVDHLPERHPWKM